MASASEGVGVMSNVSERGEKSEIGREPADEVVGKLLEFIIEL